MTQIIKDFTETQWSTKINSIGIQIPGNKNRYITMRLFSQLPDQEKAQELHEVTNCNETVISGDFK